MRVIKFVLIFLAVLLITLPLSALVIFKNYPTIESNKTILILGKGGEGHTAPNLTDTIMVAYLNKDSNKISILSLPRDIWISEIRAKLNTAYHYGGFKMAQDSIYSVTGTKISNTVVVDFSLFKDLIDSVGGINVTVENTFTDNKYPIAGKENDLCGGDKTFKCRYETVEFKQGLQRMDGETALKFVRSRNATGDEGTDLAREKRQQKVIVGVKERLLSTDVLLNPKVIKKLYETAISHTETDINVKEGLSIAKFIFGARENINFLSVPEDLIKVSQNDRKYDRQYVFIPTFGNWQKVQEWIVLNTN